MLGIRLVMGANGDGEIALFHKCRGIKQALNQLLLLIENSDRNIQNENVVISHCDNEELAEELSLLIQERFSFKKIYVVPAGGLTTLYTGEKGLVIAF